MVVGVAVSIPAAEGLRGRRMTVLKMPGDGDHGPFADILSGRCNRRRAGVALGSQRQIGDGLRQGELALWQPDELGRLHRRHRHQQAPRVGIADILAGEDHEPAGEEANVFAPLEHPGKPVETGVGIAAADALDEGAGAVVVRVAGIVDQRLALHALAGQVEGEDEGAARLGEDPDLERPQRPAGVAV